MDNNVGSNSLLISTGIPVGTSLTGSSGATLEGTGKELSSGANGYEALTIIGVLSLAGSLGNSSIEPDIIVRSEDSNIHVEKRAKMAYDKFDKKHTKKVDGNASLIAETKEVRQELDEIINNCSKEELIEALSVIEKSSEVAQKIKR